MEREYAIFVVRDHGEGEDEERYSKWSASRGRMEYLSEMLTFDLSGAGTSVTTVRVRDRIGNSVWEMEVA